MVFVRSFLLIFTGDKMLLGGDSDLRKLLCIRYVYIDVYNKRQFMSEGLGPG